MRPAIKIHLVYFYPGLLRMDPSKEALCLVLRQMNAIVEHKAINIQNPENAMKEEFRKCTEIKPLVRPHLRLHHGPQHSAFHF